MTPTEIGAAVRGLQMQGHSLREISRLLAMSRNTVRRILREPTAWILAFLVGWGILRVLALIPILGGLVWFAAVVFGLGALLVAIWRARTTSRAAPAAA